MASNKLIIYFVMGFFTFVVFVYFGKEAYEMFKSKSTDSGNKTAYETYLEGLGNLISTTRGGKKKCKQKKRRNKKY